MNFFRKVIAMAAPKLAPIIELETVGTDDHATAETGSTEIKNRCIAIMESEESVGRRSLAQHLALSTDLPVADALAALSVAPRASTAAPRTASKPDARAEVIETHNRFFAEHRAANPELWSQTAQSERPETVIERIGRHYALARGEKPAAR